jgi:hypothetical protein
MTANAAAMCSERIRPTCTRPNQNVGAARPSPSSLTSGNLNDSYRAQLRRASAHRPHTARIGSSAASASRRPVGAKKPVKKNWIHGRSAVHRLPGTAHCHATRSSATPTAASVNVAVTLSAKMRTIPRVSARPNRLAVGRTHIITLASVNGSRSSQKARAAAPAVRLPQRYASRSAPPGPVSAPYSGRGR